MQAASQILRLMDESNTKCEEAESAVSKNQKEFDDTVNRYDKEISPFDGNNPF